MTGRRFAIQQRSVGDRDHARDAVDRKSSARVVIQRVCNGVVRTVRVGGEGRDSHNGAVHGVLGHLIRAAVRISHSRDAGFIDVADLDGENVSLC